MPAALEAQADLNEEQRLKVHYAGNTSQKDHLLQSLAFMNLMNTAMAMSDTT